MSRYSFGPFLLDLEARVLLRDGEPIPMAGKTLDTLVVLVQNRGRLIGKDELLSRVWPDTVVEEANLSQNIFTVRKTLGDSPRDHRYIATVAGRGYQFVAPVVEVATPVDPAATNNQAVRLVPQLRYPFLMAGAVLGAILVTLFAIWLRMNGQANKAAGQPSQPVFFTSALGWADSPAFSPDGKQIAYSWTQEDDADRSIYVKLIGTGTELRLTTPPGRDFTPRWSPDGRYIAFFRQAPSTAGYYIVSVLGGTVREILRTNSEYFSGLDWSADGKHLVIVDDSVQSAAAQPSLQGAHPRRLVSVDIDTGTQIALTSPPTGAIGDTQPNLSPDGQQLAFTRVSADGLNEIYLFELNGHQLRQLTQYSGYILGIAWTADSREIIFGMFRSGGSRLWRMPINGGAARPITSTTETIYVPTVARRGNRLAYVIGTANQNLWRLDLVASDPPAAPAEPTRLVYSSRVQGDPMYSPDGRKLAFASNRTGSNEGNYILDVPA